MQTLVTLYKPSESILPAAAESGAKPRNAKAAQQTPSRNNPLRSAAATPRRPPAFRPKAHCLATVLDLMVRGTFFTSLRQIARLRWRPLVLSFELYHLYVLKGAKVTYLPCGQTHLDLVGWH